MTSQSTSWRSVATQRAGRCTRLFTTRVAGCALGWRKRASPLTGQRESRSNIFRPRRMNPAARRPLLVCYDGSDHAKYAIETAATLCPGSHALVASVWQRLAGLDSIAWAGEPARDGELRRVR